MISIAKYCLSVGDNALCNTLKVYDIVKHGKPRKQRSIENFCMQLIVGSGIPYSGFDCNLKDERTWLDSALEEGWFTFTKEWNRDTVNVLWNCLKSLGLQGIVALPLATVGISLRFLQENPEVMIYPSCCMKSGDEEEGTYISEFEHIKLATLNVACTEFNTMDYINGVSPTLSRIHNYEEFFKMCTSDVICLQEAFDVYHFQNIIIPSMVERGYNVAITCKRKYRIGFTAGLMIASKLPIIRTMFTAYDNTVSIDKWANKGVLAVELDTSDGESIIIVNTHLQGSFHGLSLDQKIHHRKHQFEQVQSTLTTFIEESHHRIRGIFVIGDFNTGRFTLNDHVHNNIYHAIENDDYVSMVDVLFKHPHRRFKDLMVPAIRQTFPEFFEKCNEYDTSSCKSVETGEWRGTDLNTSALSYNLLIKMILENVYYHFSDTSREYVNYCLRKVLSGKCDLHVEIETYILTLISEFFPEVYRKSNVTDHICYADSKDNQWKETDYHYDIVLPVGDVGILSDHALVEVTLSPK